MASHVRAAIMKAIRVHKFGGPEVLSLEKNVPIPKPAANQILVRVRSAGVNPVDTYMRSGNYGVLPKPPYTPGKDGAGVVEDVGAQVTHVKKGDRVYTVFSPSGSYAEYMLTDAANTFHLHGNLSFQQGAALGVPYFTAYRALGIKLGAIPGQTVLVHGASGAVGVAACQIGRALGLRVVGTAGTPEGEKLVKDNGATAVFNHREPDYTRKIKEFTGGKGVDLILEMLADVNLVKDFEMTAANAKIALIGSRGSLDFAPRLLMGIEATVMGIGLMRSTPEDYAKTAAFLHSGQELGWLRPLVGAQYGPEEVREAHTQVIAHSGGAKGKIVINFQ